MSATEKPPSGAPDYEELCRVHLPSALSALATLRDDSRALTDEVVMAAWNGMVFCHEQVEEQVKMLADEHGALSSRRALVVSFEALSEDLAGGLHARVMAADCLPRLYRLAAALKLTEKELRAFAFMVLWCDEHWYRAVSRRRQKDPVVRLCSAFARMSWAEFYAFADPERPHMKEGLLASRIEENTSFSSRRVPPAVAKALHGAPITLTEAMSIASPALGAVLAEEEGSMFSIVDGVVMLAGIPIDRTNAAPDRPQPKTHGGKTKSRLEPSEMAAMLRNLDEDHGDGAGDENDNVLELDETFSKQLLSESEMGPFKTNMEYLGAGTEIIMAAIKICKHRGDNKNHRHVGDPEDEQSAKREAEVAYRKAEVKFRLRLRMTKKSSMPQPKLERLVMRLGLSNFERFSLLMLVSHTLDSKIRMSMAETFKSRYSWRDPTFCSVGEIIMALCEGNLEKEIAARSFFYKNSPLMASGIVELSVPLHSQRNADIGDYTCHLDRTVFDYVVGLETELSEIVESAKCYTPNIDMDTVILPPKIKQLAIERVENYESFRKIRSEMGFDDIVRYGKGLNLFFHGKSGTGKTFFANALASKLNKKVLLVDNDALKENKDAGESQNLRIIFREAQVQNALIFMDECDALLGSRKEGNSRVAAILHEMETFEGVMILATNKPQCLDEAMHRRIALSLEFPEPDAQMRLDIWKRHVPKAMSLHEDVSLESLAIEFELTGGFIKNAIFEALAHAVTRVRNDRRTKKMNGDVSTNLNLSAEDVEINMKDLRTACQLQSRADLSRTTLQRRIIPVAGLETLVAPEEPMATLQEIVRVERVRRVLNTRWGFKERQVRSNCVLLMGPQGCGKTHAVGCLGFETGRPLQTLSMSELQKTEKTSNELSKMFSEAAVAGAVVVIEEGEQLLLDAAQAENIASIGMELLYNVKEYNGLVVICVTTTAVPSDAGWMASVPVPNRIAILLSYLVKLTNPNREERLRLWKQLIPSDTPREDDLDETLGAIAKKYEMNGARILGAIKRAAATAAMRGNTPSAVEKSVDATILTGQDLIDACEAEFELINAANTSAAWMRFLYA